MTTLSVEQLMSTSQPRLTVPGLVIPEGWKTPAVPSGIRPYQTIDSVFALMRQRCIIAEYPGAGKKLITIMAALKAFALGKAQSFLVITLGTDADQWVEDIDMLTDRYITTQLYRGTPKQRADMRREEVSFRITTYQTAAADLAYLYGMHEGVIMDEVSYLKNPNTDAGIRIRGISAPSERDLGNAMKALWDDHEQKLFIKSRSRVTPHLKRPFPGHTVHGTPARYVWGLSATPMETSPLDIFSLFWTIHGSKSPLGISPGKFKQQHCIVNTFRVKTPRGGKIKVEKIKGMIPESKPIVAGLIKEFYIRHPWSVVAPYLPPIEIIPLWLSMGTKQVARYKEISAGEVIADFIFQEKGVRLKSKDVNYALKLFYQLRCCDGLTSLPGQQFKESVKLARCMDLVTGELGGEKTIIYSRFHQPLDDLERKLAFEGITHTRIDGNRDDEANTKARLDFSNSAEPQILLMTGKGAYALNLQVAKYGIAYNTLYNPKKQEQLYGRNRRPGIDNVVWYHLLCRDTVEEAQWQLLRERDQEFADIFGQEEELFAHLTPEEQREILAFGHGAGLT